MIISKGSEGLLSRLFYHASNVSSCNSWVLLSFLMEASSPVDVKRTDWVGRGHMEEGARGLG